MTSAQWAIGLMTGTVLDGNIDIAAICTDGETVAEVGPWVLARYPDDVRRILPEAVRAAADWRFDGPEPPIFAEAEAALTAAQADAVAHFLASHAPWSSEVRVVGFHGQTVLHRAPSGGRHGVTRQLGDGAAMAARLGIDVVYDFRSGDMAAGGQGAPLAASYHVALLRGLANRHDAGSPGLDPHDTAVLNLGGVGNITWWAGGDEFHAFDTGPANAPINDWVRRHVELDMDRDGSLAASGRVDEVRLAKLLAHPYFAAPHPKSLDRNDFTAAMADGLSLADGAATLTAFSAGAVGKGLDLLPQRPRRLVVCGGGRRNPAFMAALAQRAGCEVIQAEDVGWHGDAIEAECFAFLAMRRLAGLPISFPKTTGVPAPMTGGRLAPRPTL